MSVGLLVYSLLVVLVLLVAWACAPAGQRALARAAGRRPEAHPVLAIQTRPQGTAAALMVHVAAPPTPEWEGGVMVPLDTTIASVNGVAVPIGFALVNASGGTDLVGALPAGTPAVQGKPGGTVLIAPAPRAVRETKFQVSLLRAAGPPPCAIEVVVGHSFGGEVGGALMRLDGTAVPELNGALLQADGPNAEKTGVVTRQLVQVACPFAEKRSVGTLTLYLTEPEQPLPEVWKPGQPGAGATLGVLQLAGKIVDDGFVVRAQARGPPDPHWRGGTAVFAGTASEDLNGKGPVPIRGVRAAASGCELELAGVCNVDLFETLPAGGTVAVTPGPTPPDEMVLPVQAIASAPGASPQAGVYVGSVVPQAWKAFLGRLAGTDSPLDGAFVNIAPTAGGWLVLTGPAFPRVAKACSGALTLFRPPPS